MLIFQLKYLTDIQRSLESGYQPEEMALDDLDEYVSTDKYDYSSYLTKDSKVLSNSTKLLILSTFLFKLFNQYKMPELKNISGAQTDFKN